MASFTLRTIPQIVADMISKVTSETQITDINDASVILTLLEAAAIEDGNTYIQMLNIIRAFSIDNLSGDDLVAKAFEYGLQKFPAEKSSGFVDFGDTSFVKVQTSVYSGLPGPSAASTSVNVVDVTGFPNAGNIIIGRGSNNVELVTYTSITNLGAYFRLNLNVGTPFVNDHGTDETVILSQGGNRVIPAGTVVYAPSGDNNDRIDFVLQSDATILDGETLVSGATVIATNTGAQGNVGAGRINSFNALPFPTATVSNPIGFSNGRDLETDSELRERIKNTIQSLSKGVIVAITTAATQVSSEEQQNKVLSAQFLEATTLNELNYLYIDDGSGLEPLVHGKGYELILNKAAGTETFLHLDPTTTPLAKAVLITQNQSPYNIPAGQTLTIAVNGVEEIITFGGITDFTDPTKASAIEVAIAMNNRLTLIEARTTNGGRDIIIQAKARINEQIEVVGGNANTALGFIQGRTIQTLRLYKNDVLLSKDGLEAAVITQNFGPYSIPNPSTLTVIVDGKALNVQTVTFTTETTPQNIVDTINAQLSGATASVVESGTKVQITSNNPIVGSSSIQVTGGTANSGGATPLDFPTDVINGIPKDYTLNRYNGQIELVTPLIANDEITAGSFYTKAFIESLVTNNYTVSIGDLLIFQADDIVDSTVTTSTSNLIFRDASLIPTYTIDDHFKNLYVRFKNTTTTVALQGISRQISAYDHTNGKITVSAIFPAVPQVGDVYEIVEIITIASNQALNAADMATFLNPLTLRASFYGRLKGNGDSFLRIQTNSFDNYGKIRVHSATTAVGLGFPTGITKSNQVSNYAFVETGNEQNYTVGLDQTLIIIVDNDPINKTVSIKPQVSGTVTTSTSNTTFSDINLVNPYPISNFFTDFRCRFADNTPTVALRGAIRNVLTYNNISGQIVVTAVFPAVPAVNDIFELIPTTAKNVVDLFNSVAFSPLPSLANISASNDGTKVQISSKNIGTIGSIQVAGGTANDFSISFITDGTAGGQANVNSKDGLSVGLQLLAVDDNSAAVPVTITNIAGGAAPYTITVSVNAGGTDISAFTVAQNARFKDWNQFLFNTSPIEGIDGYTYHGGLIQQTQWTIDGRDDDVLTYPGVKAAGVQIEVNAPTLTFISISVNITTIGSLSLSAVQNSVKAAISQYVNSLGVGEDVILSEIVANVLNKVYGVTDIKILSPSDNIIIQNNELCKVRDTDILVG